MKFDCEYSTRGSATSLAADSLNLHVLLDSGREKACRIEGRQMTAIQYFIDVKNGTVIFLEVTPDKEVKMTTVVVGKSSAHSRGASQY